MTCKVFSLSAPSHQKTKTTQPSGLRRHPRHFDLMRLLFTSLLSPPPRAVPHTRPLRSILADLAPQKNVLPEKRQHVHIVSPYVVHAIIIVSISNPKHQAKNVFSQGKHLRTYQTKIITYQNNIILYFRMQLLANCFSTQPGSRSETASSCVSALPQLASRVAVAVESIQKKWLTWALRMRSRGLNKTPVNFYNSSWAISSRVLLSYCWGMFSFGSWKSCGSRRGSSRLTKSWLWCWGGEMVACLVCLYLDSQNKLWTPKPQHWPGRTTLWTLKTQLSMNNSRVKKPCPKDSIFPKSWPIYEPYLSKIVFT